MSMSDRNRYWLEWIRTTLAKTEAQELVSSLAPDQRDQLAKEDYVWIRGTGVVFRDPEGDLHLARFTHGAHFRTRQGELYIGSDGKAKRVAPVRIVRSAEEGTDRR